MQSILEDHWISQAELALGGTWFALYNHLPAFRMFRNIFKDDLIYDLKKKKVVQGMSLLLEKLPAWSWRLLYQ